MKRMPASIGPAVAAALLSGWVLPAWMLPPGARAGEAAGVRKAGFAAGPTVAKAAGGFEIRFTAAARTDAAVEVIAADGKIVRHLAAGVLGEKAPEPLQPGSLSQTVSWDGKDDAGAAVPAGTYSVRVGLGMKPAFDAVIGWSGQNIGRPGSLAVDADGTLYVLFFAGEGHHTPGEPFISAFDRDGRYLRQVMPFPANLPAEKVAGARPIPVGEKGWMPVLYHALVHTLYPHVVGMSRQTMALTGDGKILLAAPDGRGGMVLLRVGKDASAGGDFVGPSIAKGVESYHHLAVSPDGRGVYAAGFNGKKRWDYKNLHHVVYRGQAQGREAFEVYLGKPFQAGADGGLLNDPRGLAFDGRGNLYVAEHGNNRVSVWSPEAKLLAAIPVPDPDQVAVHPRTGKVYVFTAHNRLGVEQENFTSGSNWYTPRRLIRFSSFQAPKIEAELTIPGGREGATSSVFALDSGADPPVLWVGPWAYGDGGIYKIIDRGEKLEPAGRAIAALNDQKLPFVTPRHICVPRSGETVYLDQRRYDGRTGSLLGDLGFFWWERSRNPQKRVMVGRPGFGEEAADPQGRFVIHRSGMGEVFRLAPDGKAVSPFPSTGSPLVEDPSTGQKVTLYGGFMHPRGVAVALNGDVYVVHHLKQFRDRHRTAVTHIDKGGKIARTRLITVEGPSAGVRVDRKGNVYLGTTIRPMSEGKERSSWGAPRSEDGVPSFFRGRLPRLEGYFYDPVYWYEMVYGSVVKFGPEGGKIVIDKAGEWLLGTDQGGDVAWPMKGRIEGAKWVHFGISPMPFKGNVAAGGGCVCETARFDLDGHDRLFIPDALRFSVEVLDSEGNFITRFGEYGNMDSRGPLSPVPTPEIPFGWPLAVAASDSDCYVADYTNFRAVKVKFGYEAEKLLPVKLP